MGMSSKTTAYTGEVTVSLEQQRCWEQCSNAAGLCQSHPMLVMPIPDLIAMEALPPHEAVKDKLVEWSPGMGAVFFFSHTWLKFTSPDNDANDKFHLLRDFMRRILKGDVGDISLGAATYYGKQTLSGAKMRRDASSGFVWCDYFSIPQADVEAQTRAISSIVSFVNSSAYFMCLCGAWLHESGDVRDANAWAARGYTRHQHAEHVAILALRP